MDICLVGDFSGNSDEGMKVVAQNLAKKLERTHNVLRFNVYDAFRIRLWHRLIRFSPSILHYVSGPSPMSFIILRALLLGCKVQSRDHVHTVMSATQPWLPFNTASFLRKLKPDLLLVQSDRIEKHFRHLGFCVKYLPNGVDVKKFRPANEHQKEELRAKYGFGADQFIVLHVGPVRANRGLDVMRSFVSTRDCTVLVVGSTSSPLEKPTFLDLMKGGCTVWRKYMESIHEIYQLADVYVFPVEDSLGSIDVPLSVLEAMACNLPVVVTTFGGFPRMFPEGDGFFFVTSRHEIPKIIKDIRNHGIRDGVHTRRKVMPFSWDNISRILSRYYSELLHCGNC